jgi:hypothetical protein
MEAARIEPIGVRVERVHITIYAVWEDRTRWRARPGLVHTLTLASIRTAIKAASGGVAVVALGPAISPIKAQGDPASIEHRDESRLAIARHQP